MISAPLLGRIPVVALQGRDLLLAPRLKQFSAVLAGTVTGKGIPIVMGCGLRGR